MSENNESHGVEKPKEKVIEEKKGPTKEQVEALVDLIMTVEPILYTMNLEHLKAAKEELIQVGSNDDALGCLLKPDGYHQRSAVREAKIHYLTGLIEVREALGELASAMKDARNTRHEVDDVMKRMGIL